MKKINLILCLFIFVIFNTSVNAVEIKKIENKKIENKKTEDNKYYIQLSNERKKTDPILDGKYYNWNVYYLEDKDGNKQCYIASFKDKSIGNYKEKREPYIMITYFKAKEKEEISIYSGGFDYRKNSIIYVAVDKIQYKLITKDKMAWTKSEVEDNKIIQNILNSKEIKVRSETIDNEYTVDTYSGQGALMAYNRAKELCN